MKAIRNIIVILVIAILLMWAGNSVLAKGNGGGNGPKATAPADDDCSLPGHTCTNGDARSQSNQPGNNNASQTGICNGNPNGPCPGESVPTATPTTEPPPVPPTATPPTNPPGNPDNPTAVVPTTTCGVCCDLGVVINPAGLQFGQEYSVTVNGNVTWKVTIYDGSAKSNGLTVTGLCSCKVPVLLQLGQTLTVKEISPDGQTIIWEMSLK